MCQIFSLLGSVETTIITLYKCVSKCSAILTAQLHAQQVTQYSLPQSQQCQLPQLWDTQLARHVSPDAQQR